MHDLAIKDPESFENISACCFERWLEGDCPAGQYWGYDLSCNATATALPCR